ncbi:FAD-dependent monooxygenase [Leucobacter sp. M11]|uniref:FAD-dependent monooxygenase n=1 Tax=Leucobacter sp. M11 TaxID=2993565 RepID=UPI002D7F47B9|nr:FAD-dependent monooxygenase [Leucobacter sp. M11]MEB4613755.1 FAD-dependent monooxygenase [Leucobacter sp. M11]
MDDTAEEQPPVDVLIVGAGPAGLTLAAELLLNGVSVRIIDARESPMSESRAIGLTIGALEHLLRRGQYGQLQVGSTRQEVHFGGFPMSTAGLPTRLEPAIDIPQHRTEAALLHWVEELGGRVERGSRLTGLDQDDTSVTCTVSDSAGVSRQISARYVAGCDGSKSAVRSFAGLNFDTTAPSIQMLLGDFVDTDLPTNPFGKRNHRGMVMSGPIGDGAVRVIAAEFGRPFREHGAAVSADEIMSSYTRIVGSGFIWGSLRWGSSFTDATGVASRLVAGRIVILGDAARRHLPAGGQGMNSAILDAACLGWHLSRALNLASNEPLQQFEDERLAASRALVINTQAQGQLFLRGQEVDALRDVFGRLLQASGGHHTLVRDVSSIGVRYEFADDGTDFAVGLPLLSGHLPRRPWTQLLDGLQKHGGWLYIHTPGADPSTVRAAETCGIPSLEASLLQVDELISHTFMPAANRDSALIRPDGVIAWTSLSDKSLSEVFEYYHLHPTATQPERS